MVDERVDLGLDQRGFVGIDTNRVGGQEQVRLVVVELGSLMRAERVLDGQLVEAELVGELVELLLRRTAQVDPHHGVGFGEVVGHLCDREVLGLEHPVAIHACVDAVHGWSH